MIDFIKNIFKKDIKYRFYDKDNKEIKYKEYLKEENALIIENNNGLEKIPVEGLIKKEVK